MNYKVVEKTPPLIEPEIGILRLPIDILDTLENYSEDLVAYFEPSRNKMIIGDYEYDYTTNFSQISPEIYALNDLTQECFRVGTVINVKRLDFNSKTETKFARDRHQRHQMMKFQEDFEHNEREKEERHISPTRSSELQSVASLSPRRNHGVVQEVIKTKSSTSNLNVRPVINQGRSMGSSNGGRSNTSKIKVPIERKSESNSLPELKVTSAQTHNKRKQVTREDELPIAKSNRKVNPIVNDRSPLQANKIVGRLVKDQTPFSSSTNSIKKYKTKTNLASFNSSTFGVTPNVGSASSNSPDGLSDTSSEFKDFDSTNKVLQVNFKKGGAFYFDTQRDTEEDCVNKFIELIKEHKEKKQKFQNIYARVTYYKQTLANKIGEFGVETDIHKVKQIKKEMLELIESKDKQIANVNKANKLHQEVIFLTNELTKVQAYLATINANQSDGE